MRNLNIEDFGASTLPAWMKVIYILNGLELYRTRRDADLQWAIIKCYWAPCYSYLPIKLRIMSYRETCQWPQLL